MKNRLIGSTLFLLCFASVSWAQTGARIFGAQQFVLDDNTLANPKVYLSQNVGSLGIDNSGVVSIGTFPSPCALLDLRSTTKGFLVPRMNTAQEAAICGGTPTEGLMVYNITTHTIDVYNGALWGAIAPSWGLSGNTGTTPATNFLGTVDAQDFVVRTFNIERLRVLGTGNNAGAVGIGTTTPFGQLQVLRTQTNPVASGSNLGIYSVANFQPTGASSLKTYGIYGEGHSRSTFSISSAAVTGIGGDAELDASSTFAPNAMIGVSGIVINNASIPIPSAEGIRGQVYSTVGNITDGIGVNSIPFVQGGSITTMHGLHINDVVSFGGGTVTNHYGVDIDPLTYATNNVALRYNHATQPVQINGNGDVRIGGLAPTTTTGLFTTRTATIVSGGAKVATESQMIASPASTSFLQYIGTYSHVDGANTSAINGGGLYGLWGGAELLATTAAPVFSARGVFGELFYQTNQTLNDGAALAGIVDIEGAGGTINLASGTRLSFNAPSAATITDLKMLNVLDFFANAGTITNTYGLYIGDITIGTQTNKAYSIYASDINTRSFINGNTGFGPGELLGPATDPKSAVDIAGALSIRYQNHSYLLNSNPTVSTSAFLNFETPTSQLGYIGILVPAGGGTISGFAPATNGRMLIFHKTGGALTLNNEDAVNEATASNRIHCMSGANVTIPAGEAMITVIHEGDNAGSINRWVVLSVNTVY